jgi:hypothetical protein
MPCASRSDAAVWRSAWPIRKDGERLADPAYNLPRRLLLFRKLGHSVKRRVDQRLEGHDRAAGVWEGSKTAADWATRKTGEALEKRRESRAGAAAAKSKIEPVGISADAEKPTRPPNPESKNPVIVRTYQKDGPRTEKKVREEFERDANKLAGQGYEVANTAAQGAAPASLLLGGLGLWKGGTLTVTYQLTPAERARLDAQQSAVDAYESAKRDYKARKKKRPMPSESTVADTTGRLPGRETSDLAVTAAAATAQPAEEGDAPIAETVSATPSMKTCPRCAEDVRYAALVCRYCGHEFARSSSGDGRGNR